MAVSSRRGPGTCGEHLSLTPPCSETYGCAAPPAGAGARQRAACQHCVCGGVKAKPGWRSHERWRSWELQEVRHRVASGFAAGNAAPLGLAARLLHRCTGRTLHWDTHRGYAPSRLLPAGTGCAGAWLPRLKALQPSLQELTAVQAACNCGLPVSRNSHTTHLECGMGARLS